MVQMEEMFKEVAGFIALGVQSGNLIENIRGDCQFVRPFLGLFLNRQAEKGAADQATCFAPTATR